jgi:hypothetical protein
MVLDGKQANDFFHLITWRSPLRRKPVRDIVRAFARLAIASEDPGMVAMGTATEAIVDQFEKRARIGTKGA